MTRCAVPYIQKPVERTLYTVKATETTAIPNKTYAVTRAPRPNVLLPLELEGFISSPIMTESLPVPNASPKAMRRQNSTVAQRKGTNPMINISIFTSGERLASSIGIVEGERSSLELRRRR